MFERFTQEARTVVRAAVAAAQQEGSHTIGTEHLLIGLVEADHGIAGTLTRDAGLNGPGLRRRLAAHGDAAVLSSVGIDLPAVRARVEDDFGQGALERAARRRRRGHVGRRRVVHRPFTAGAKAALELSLREAIRLGDREIRGAHVLLGLLREGGVAASLLADVGVDAAAIEARAAR